MNTSSLSPHSVVARYAVRRRDRFWLLERTDTKNELALFDTQQQAVVRAERLAKESAPSVLEIVHTAHNVEARHYPSLPLSPEPLREVTSETRL